MSVIRSSLTLIAARARRRAADESGFTMIVAMMVLMVVTLLIGAAFVAANGDIGNSRHDIDQKRALYAARAGLSQFLYRLNKDTELWKTCPSQTATTVPGTASDVSAVTYAYSSMGANGNASCSTSNPVNTFIDKTTGSFRMKFTGTAGNPQVTRTIVAQFKRKGPLDYLWYSTYETLDPNTYDDPSNYADCATFRRDGRASKCGDIQWVSGDNIRGPMYTQDQFFVCGSPTFGRANSNDAVQSAAPASDGAVVLSSSYSCSPNNPTYNGQAGNPLAGAGTIPAPNDNTALLPYATSYGKVYTGKTTIVLNGSSATITNASASGCTSGCTVNLVTYPIIYVNNGACSANYSPYFAGNTAYTGATSCGNVLIKGNYTTPITIAAANDIIVNGNITTDLSGSAVAGLVANNFIRVMHGLTYRDGTTKGDCDEGGWGGQDAENDPTYTLSNVRIDAAILALKHSFIVDNYDCGNPIGTAPSYKLTVNGAIAQLFRGTVGTGGGSISTGYLKDYNYDDRLAVLQPPFLFDLASSAWRVVRETQCIPGSSDTTLAC
jgi:Tfp pilus assembly protein PilX